MTSLELAQRIEKLLNTCEYFHHTEIGTSRKGKPIHALTIGHGSRQVLINAAHHANEWFTAPLLMKFLEERAADFAFIKPPRWAESVTLHAIPMVNPDGVDMVIEGAGEFDHWKANAIGVDLNSNYPASWEKARARKFAQGYTTPGPRDYVGPAPLSEPETCAMVAYTTTHDIDITLSLHSQGEEIYHKYMDYKPIGAEELAICFAAVSGYAIVDVPEESSHGGYRDWFISTFNRPGFTIECGLGENPLPISELDGIYKKVSRILWEALV